MAASGLSWKQTDHCPLDKQPSRNWPGMQIGQTCSKMYSNLHFAVGLFATGGDEEERAVAREMGVACQPQSKPSSCSHEENNSVRQYFFS